MIKYPRAAPAAVAEFAELLRKSYWAKEGNLASVIDVIQSLPADYRSMPDVIELTDLVSKASKIPQQ